VSLEPYVWLKWLHGLSSAVLVGTVLGSAVHFWLAHRSRRVRVVATVARNIVKTDRWVTLPAVIVQLVTGLGLLIVMRIPVDAPWLVASYGLFLVAFGFWVSLVVVQARVRELALEASTGAPLRYAYHQAMKRWIVLVWPIFGALVLIFLLMTVKPKFW
jgi:uncharacterized membrane protein